MSAPKFVVLLVTCGLLGCAEGTFTEGGGVFSQDTAPTAEDADPLLEDEHPPLEAAVEAQWSAPLSGPGPFDVHAVLEAGALVLDTGAATPRVISVDRDGVLQWTADVPGIVGPAVLGVSPTGGSVVVGNSADARDELVVQRISTWGDLRWSRALPAFEGHLAAVSASIQPGGLVGVLSEANNGTSTSGVLDLLDADGVVRVRETMAGDDTRPLGVVAAEGVMVVFSEFAQYHRVDGQRWSTSIRVYDDDGVLFLAKQTAVEFTAAWLTASQEVYIGGIVDDSRSCVIPAYPFDTIDTTMKESPYDDPAATAGEWILTIEDGAVLAGILDREQLHFAPEGGDVIAVDSTPRPDVAFFAVSRDTESGDATLHRVELSEPRG